VSEIAVVVPTHARALRLRWLLDALEQQTLERDRFEVVVVDDASADGGRTAATLERFAGRGRLALRVLRRERSAGPATARNAGWRSTTAPLVAFTDDDCRPAPDWLERLLDAARRHPGAIVQGATHVDPDELHVFHAAPHARSQQETDPPGPWAQGCNIAYPRELLERVDGFDERFPAAAGEDTDLARRAQEAGAAYVGAPDAIAYHAVVAGSLVARARDARRWGNLAAVLRRHPAMRRHLALRLFWRPSHGWLLLALGAAAVVRRPGPALLAALPWALAGAPRYGSGPRALVRSAVELPGRLVVDLAEIAAAAAGSVRHRTPFL
jgi:GT2 family glycosyltransferase